MSDERLRIPVTSLSAFAVGERIGEYLREQHACGFTLVRSVLGAERTTGEWFAIGPTDIDERLYAFGSGGLLPRSTHRTKIEGGWIEPVSNTDPWLAARAPRVLAEDPRRVLVVELFTPPREDGHLVRDEIRVLLTRDSVCGGACSIDADSRVLSIAKCVRHLPVGLGVVSRLDVSAETWLDGREELDADDVAMLATRAEFVILGAYDGESAVVWAADPDAFERTAGVPVVRGQAAAR